MTAVKIIRNTHRTSFKPICVQKIIVKKHGLPPLLPCLIYKTVIYFEITKKNTASKCRPAGLHIMNVCGVYKLFLNFAISCFTVKCYLHSHIIA